MFRDHESVFRQEIPAKSYTILRVDGRAFSSLTKRLDKPFSQDFTKFMDTAALALCHEVQGVQFAYTQSDEISLLMTDFREGEQRWFGGVVPKVLSIASCTASNAFNEGFTHNGYGYRYEERKPAQFDARVFTLPDRMTTMQYFLWRQADAFKNAVSMAASNSFSPKQLEGVDTTGRLAMLAAIGYRESDIPLSVCLGRIVHSALSTETFSYIHKRTRELETATAERRKWYTNVAPWLDWDEKGFLSAHVPERG